MRRRQQKVAYLLIILVAHFGSTRHQNVETQIEDDVLRAVPLPRDDSALAQQHIRCQSIKVAFCDDFGYNRTALPNMIGHENWHDVISEINMFYPLVNLNCSADLRYFLCVVYVPMCFDIKGSSSYYLYPCRSFCKSVRNDCAKHLKAFIKGDWPLALKCEALPDDSNDTVMCIGRQTRIESKPSTTQQTPPARIESRPNRSNYTFVCPENLRHHSYNLNLFDKIYSNCALPCDNFLVDETRARMVLASIFLLASLSIISILWTCYSFHIHSADPRFNYPLRPVIVMAYCQFVVALCFMLSIFSGNRFACNKAFESTKPPMITKIARTVVMGNEGTYCTAQFMILYFAHFSTIVWWLILGVSWFLIARLGWASEAVEGLSNYFHFFAWSLAALPTLYLALSGNIQGDPLSGTCYAEMSNSTVRNIVIIPVSIIFILGVFLLSAGFRSVYLNWDTIRQQYHGRNRNRGYSSFYIRLGLFSLVSIIALFCYIYSMARAKVDIDLWMLNRLTEGSANFEPPISVLMTKYFALLALGPISSLCFYGM